MNTLSAFIGLIAAGSLTFYAFDTLADTLLGSLGVFLIFWCFAWLVGAIFSDLDMLNGREKGD